jgi:nicotinamidase-related amidase
MQKKSSRPALLVLDCQNYFLDPGSPKYLKGSRAMVPRINRLTGAAAAAGWPVVFTVHRAPRKPGNLMAGRYERLPAGRECRPWPGIIRPKKSYLIKKEHYSAFHRTGLERMLRRLGVTDILLCGVMTHLCVDTTARHGFMLGFRPTIVSDACCSKSPAYHRAALLALEHGFAEVVTAREALGLAV